jgi:arabinan endo-1,5-alpha-L-arabinosidase
MALSPGTALATCLGLVGVSAFALAPRASQGAAEMLALDGDLSPVHDPVMIKEKDTYYVFCTGGRNGSGVLPIRTSKDLRTWTRTGFVFPDSLPEWTKTEIPRANNAWAPDIARHNGKYLLYYSVSSFGSRDSAIGLVTNTTLDPSSPDYRWIDEGMVVRSFQDKDDWNAIDPNLFVEDERNVWLSWGSFWGGIKMRRVDPATGRLSASETTLYSLSSRPRAQPIGGAVEAPFIVKRGRYFYLFVSFDRCCRGAMSTYNVRVGRAERVTGPYVDRGGVAMTEGGGTLVLEATTPAWRGPGHQAIVADAARDLMLFHAYPAQGRGSSLFISTMVWEDGWPRVGVLPG